MERHHIRVITSYSIHYTKLYEYSNRLNVGEQTSVTGVIASAQAGVALDLDFPRIDMPVDARHCFEYADELVCACGLYKRLEQISYNFV